MNVFTNLLFFDIARPAEPHAFDETDERFRGFGNRVASERFFAPLGHARTGLHPDSAVADRFDDALGCCA